MKENGGYYEVLRGNGKSHECGQGYPDHCDQGLGLTASADFRTNLAAEVFGYRVTDDLADHERSLEVDFRVHEPKAFIFGRAKRLAKGVHAEVRRERGKNGVNDKHP